MRKLVFFPLLLLMVSMSSAGITLSLKVVGDIAVFSGSNNKLDEMVLVNNMMVANPTSPTCCGGFFEIYNLDNPLAPEYFGSITDSILNSTDQLAYFDPIIGDNTFTFFFSDDSTSGDYYDTYINAIGSLISPVLLGEKNLNSSISIDDALVWNNNIYIIDDAISGGQANLHKVNFNNPVFTYMGSLTLNTATNHARIIGHNADDLLVAYGNNGFIIGVIDMASFTQTNTYQTTESVHLLENEVTYFADEVNNKQYVLAPTSSSVSVYDVTNPSTITKHTTITNTGYVVNIQVAKDRIFMSNEADTFVLSEIFSILDTISGEGDPRGSVAFMYNSTHYFNYLGFNDRTDVVEFSPREFTPLISSLPSSSSSNTPTSASSSTPANSNSSSADSASPFPIWSFGLLFPILVVMRRKLIR